MAAGGIRFCVREEILCRRERIEWTANSGPAALSIIFDKIPTFMYGIVDRDTAENHEM